MSDTVASLVSVIMREAFSLITSVLGWIAPS